MPEYRRAYIPGSIVFLTCVTYQRKPIFQSEDVIQLLRNALAQTQQEKPFKIVGAVILPDHLHFLWQLPLDDPDYSRRVGRMKALFTRLFRGHQTLPTDVSLSRQKHRECDVWQRRFWERSLCNSQEVNHYLNYIHYNRVKHGLVACPHAWSYSSFSRYVKRGDYLWDWGCQCQGNAGFTPDFGDILDRVGE